MVINVNIQNLKKKSWESLYRLVSHHAGAVDLLPTVSFHEIVTLEAQTEENAYQRHDGTVPRRKLNDFWIHHLEAAYLRPKRWQEHCGFLVGSTRLMLFLLLCLLRHCLLVVCSWQSFNH